MIILITWCMSLKIKDTYLIIVGLGKEVISVKTAQNIFSDLPQSNFSAAPTKTSIRHHFVFITIRVNMIKCAIPCWIARFVGK